jgi:hypothetical protein
MSAKIRFMSVFQSNAAAASDDPLLLYSRVDLRRSVQ